MKYTILTFVLLGCLSTHAADLIVLKSGYEINGSIQKIKHCTITVQHETGKLKIPSDSIAYVGFEDADNRLSQRFSSQDGLCSEAIRDSRLYHGKRLSHLALGFFLGPVAIAGTYASNPDPTRGKYADDNPNKDRFEDPDYLACYRTKTRGRLILHEVVGFGTMLSTVFIIYLIGVNAVD